ncbi:hypothetical protein NPIL_307081 [Nephila pilipes]|uniref:Uncharacterized protein n=1 Tax=Nephila pilipes TaxID=299642 RepID=A0A8X6NFS8_NEPPI|nr:hypothetical protein NPIL_307081 [Nephila pilipes]
MVIGGAIFWRGVAGGVVGRGERLGEASSDGIGVVSFASISVDSSSFLILRVLKHIAASSFVCARFFHRFDVRSVLWFCCDAPGN